jgi:putative transposase
MTSASKLYRRHRFPPQIISHAVWLYHRFALSFRDVEDLLSQRRAVDQDGDVIDILVRARRNQRAAKRFLRKLVEGQGGEPNRLVTDKLRSYVPAHREVMPSVPHDSRRGTVNLTDLAVWPTQDLALTSTTKHSI